MLWSDGEAKLFLLLLHCDGDGTQSRDGWMDYLVVVGTRLSVSRWVMSVVVDDMPNRQP